MAGKQNIVVVGGGGAGYAAARGLAQKLDPKSHTLTLVTARPFYSHLPAFIRMVTSSQDKVEEQALISYDKAFPAGLTTVRIGRVTSIEAKEGKGGVVVLESGDSIPYDVLVLAPGSHWPGPVEIPDDRTAALAHVKDWRRKFENAKGVVIVGGGSVGIGTLPVLYFLLHG